MMLGVAYCGAMIPYLGKIRMMDGGLGLAGGSILHVGG